MIHSIEIQDFQSIESIGFECGPITVLVGESDVGKSAVVRALYALAHNDYPSDHVREGAKFSAVKVHVDGEWVVARKGAGVNVYELGQVGEFQKWERVGRDVPALVSETLGWRVVELEDGTKLVPSIARQFDPPFLLSESPLRAAKLLGSLTNISRLYEAIREGSNRERRVRTQAKDVGARAEELFDEVAESREGLDARLEWLEGVAGRLEEAARVEARMDSLLELRERVRVGNQERGAAQQVRDEAARRRAVDLTVAGEAADRLQVLRSVRDRLIGAEKEYGAARAAVEAAAAAYERAGAEQERVRAEMDVCPLCGQRLAEPESKAGVWPMSSQWGPS